MKIKLLPTLLATIAILFSAATAFADMPKLSDTAPSFTGVDQNGKDFKLANLVGKKNVLLYFYPWDFLGLDVKEACSFRNDFQDFATNNVEIVGVSFDSADSHLKFITKYKLPFTLLADTHGNIVDIYGVRTKSHDGNPIAERVSFLIGLDGKIVHVTASANPDVHLAEMKNSIASLKKN